MTDRNERVNMSSFPHGEDKDSPENSSPSTQIWTIVAGALTGAMAGKFIGGGGIDGAGETGLLVVLSTVIAIIVLAGAKEVKRHG
jgi:hypothetical protein